MELNLWRIFCHVFAVLPPLSPRGSCVTCTICKSPSGSFALIMFGGFPPSKTQELTCFMHVRRSVKTVLNRGSLSAFSSLWEKARPKLFLTYLSNLHRKPQGRHLLTMATLGRYPIFQINS